ncbi:MAG: cytochrome c [Rhizomicrobium sp.]
MRIWLHFLIWTVAAVADAQAAQNVQAGRELAIDACSACHQVTPDQKPRPPVFNTDEQTNVTAPAFSVVAKKYAGRPSALRKFILAPTHPMREQIWAPVDLTAVVAFIQSLNQPASAPRTGR